MGYRKLPTMVPLCLAVFMARDALGLGLGAANLDSRLGQPLFARIPIFGAEGIGSEDVRVSLRSVIDPKTGIEIASIDKRSISAVGEIGESGTGTIYLRSNTPVDEPYLHFLISVRWPGGELSRAYTLLLDLPENIVSDDTNSTKSIVNSNPIISSRNISTAAAIPSVYSAVKPIGQDSSIQAISADTSFYTTVRGDNLWSISKRVARARGGDASVWMDRLYRNNPKAFIRNNRNLLKERVVLDLFESVVEPEPASSDIENPVAFVQKKVQMLQSMPQQEPQATLDGSAALSRRELESLAEDATQALTEQQFILQNLDEVRNQVADVSASIVAMSEKLVALQAQLQDLNAEYARLSTTDSSTSLPVAEQSGSDVPEQVVAVSDNEESGDLLGAQADDIDVTVLVNEDGASFGVETAAAQQLDGEAGLVKGASIEARRQSLIWLWWLLPLVAGVFLYSRRRKANEAVVPRDDGHEYSVNLADVNAAVAANAQAERIISKDNFNDIFSALGAKTAGSSRGEVTPSSEALDQSYLAENSLPANRKPTTATLDEIALSSSRTAANAGLDDIDDDFFADFDEDALLQDGGLDDESEFLALDIPDLEDSWLLQESDNESEASTRVSACMEMDDLDGAREILEREITVNDELSLKLQLLDVYARCGDQDEFERLVSHVEASSPDVEILTEITELRKQLKNNVFFLGEGRAD